MGMYASLRPGRLPVTELQYAVSRAGCSECVLILDHSPPQVPYLHEVHLSQLTMRHD
jgi:hypothetical protein